MRDLSPMIVAEDQDKRHLKDVGILLTDQLTHMNTPSKAGKLPVDLMHTVDGRPVMGDLKTIDDFIASYTDGRLHSQITSMQNAHCWFYYLCIIGDPTSEDGGYFVGERQWTWDQFEDAVESVQVHGGVKILRAPSKALVARRLAAHWKWTGKEDAPSWHSPVPAEAYNDFKNDIIFYDETYRSQTSSLMHWPGFGLKTAKQVRDSMAFMECWGITEEGLETSNKRLLAIKGIGPKMVADREKWIRS